MTTTAREAVPGEVTTGTPLLRVRDLQVTFASRGRDDVRAVDGVSFDVAAGSTVGIVGESGSGKSVTSLAAMGLLPRRGVRVSGSVEFDGQDLLNMPEDELRSVRGREIAMVFQDPMSSLNPVLTVGRQITEILERHQGLKGRDARQRAATLLDNVGIADSTRRLRSFPHQLSGGMRQRVMIAMALACGPRLLIADEPTTALDVTIQAQILVLMRKLGAETGASIILITHDLGVVAEMAQRVIVMYAGRKVEEAGVEALFAHPRHPYTRGLLGSMPHLRSTTDDADGDAPPERLVEIEGMVPSLKEEIDGCLFAPRCPNATERCRQEVPPMTAHGPGHVAACWHPIAEPAKARRALEVAL